MSLPGVPEASMPRVVRRRAVAYAIAALYAPFAAIFGALAFDDVDAIPIGARIPCGVLGALFLALTIRQLMIGVYPGPDGVLIRHVLSSRRLEWSQIDRFEFGHWRGGGSFGCGSARLTDGTEVTIFALNPPAGGPGPIPALIDQLNALLESATGRVIADAQPPRRSSVKASRRPPAKHLWAGGTAAHRHQAPAEEAGIAAASPTADPGIGTWSLDEPGIAAASEAQPETAFGAAPEASPDRARAGLPRRHRSPGRAAYRAIGILIALGVLVRIGVAIVGNHDSGHHAGRATGAGSPLVQTSPPLSTEPLVRASPQAAKAMAQAIVKATASQPYVSMFDHYRNTHQFITRTVDVAHDYSETQIEEERYLVITTGAIRYTLVGRCYTKSALPAGTHQSPQPLIDRVLPTGPQIAYTSEDFQGNTFLRWRYLAPHGAPPQTGGARAGEVEADAKTHLIGAGFLKDKRATQKTFNYPTTFERHPTPSKICPKRKQP